MKANSVGLEIQIGLTLEEIKSLPSVKKISGILNFREVNSDVVCPIPLSLNYYDIESQEIRVEQFPNGVYMGRAKRVYIFLPHPFYARLLEEGYCGDRFNKSGRIDILKIS